MKLKGRPSNVSAEQVAQIYELYDTNEYGYRLIAKKLDLTKDQVRYYIKRRMLENQKSSET